MIKNFEKVTNGSKSNRRMIVSLYGREGTGKSSFGFSAPGPILYFNFDTGDEGVIEKFSDTEMYRVRYRAKAFSTMDDYKILWSQFKQDFINALKSGAKTLVVDTATEAWELNRLARLGKLAQVLPVKYTEVNREHTDLLVESFESDKNVVLIHKAAPVYINDKRTKDYEMKGFKETPFIVKINLEMYKQDGEYYMRVMKCRENKEVEQMELPVYDPKQGFEILRSMVWE